MMIVFNLLTHSIGAKTRYVILGQTSNGAFFLVEAKPRYCSPFRHIPNCFDAHNVTCKKIVKLALADPLCSRFLTFLISRHQMLHKWASLRKGALDNFFKLVNFSKLIYKSLRKIMQCVLCDSTSL